MQPAAVRILQTSDPASASSAGNRISCVGKVMIYVQNPRSVKELKLPGKLYLTMSVTGALEEAFGKENLSLVPGRAPL